MMMVYLQFPIFVLKKLNNNKIVDCFQICNICFARISLESLFYCSIFIWVFLSKKPVYI